MDENSGDKKLLGNKKLLFNVIKKERLEKDSDKKKQIPGRFVTTICNRTSLILDNTNINTNLKLGLEADGLMSQTQIIENKEIFNFPHQLPAGQVSSCKENKTSNLNKISNPQLLIGTTHGKDFSFSWRDKSSITFDKIIWKYHLNKDNTHISSSSSNSLTGVELKEMMTKNEYGFKIFFNDNPSLVYYSYNEVKNSNLNLLEKKHRGKITQIIIEVNERKEPLMQVFNIPSKKLEKYRSHLNNLVDNNVVNLYLQNISSYDITESLVDEFFMEFPLQWDYFEYIAIQVIAERYSFQEYMCYICLYLYDNLRKLKDQKSTDHLRSKIKESCTLAKDMSWFSKEMMRYYTRRHEKMRSALTPFIKEQNWTEESSLTEIFMSTLIYTKFLNTQEIDLTQHYILNDNIMTVLSALKCNQSVAKLILNSNKIGEEGMWFLGRVLCYNHRLSDIDVSFNSLNDSSIKAFVMGRMDGVNSNSNSNSNSNFNLFNLNLFHQHSEISENCVDLNKKIENFSNFSFPIIKLNLSSNQFLTHECGRYIAKIVEMSPYLNHLNLSKIALEDRGFEPILKTLINLAEMKKMKLETFIIFNTKLSSETLDLFSKLLSLHGCTLKSLILSDNKFEYNSAINLFNSIGQNNTLEELSMLNCEITNEMAEFIIKMISSNSSLKCLYLYNNKIDSATIFKKILGEFSKNYDIEKNSNFNNAIQNQHLIGNSFCRMPLADLDILQIPDDIEFTFENIYDLKETREENLEYRGEVIKIKADSNNINTNTNININEKNFTYCHSNMNSNICKKMKYLDLSKNRCKILIDDEFIKIIENLDLESLDISQNFEVNTSDDDMVKKFKDAITKIQEKTKIIY